MPKVKKSCKTCVICLETIKNRKEARITSCRHRYCRNCIRKWSKIDNRCPQCKRHFNWIIDVHRNKKEKVVKQTRVNIVEFMVDLIRNFLYNNNFRYTMTTAIMRANTTALALFDFLYHIVIDFDIKHIVDVSGDTSHAFSWLHLMKTVRSQ